MSLTAAPAYTPGDLSRLLNPSAPAPAVTAPLVDGRPDPTFFGYLKPKGRMPSRKAPKGGGKFSKQTQNKRVKGKKLEQKAAREKHEQEKAAADEKKKAAREKHAAEKGEAASGSDDDAASDAEDAAVEEDEAEDSGVDESDGSLGDDVDEEAIEAFVREIEEEGAEDVDSDELMDSEDEEAREKRVRKEKREKRLREDEEMEAPQPRKKDIKKQRLENLANDPRLPRTIFVGNVPALLKSSKLGVWLQTKLGVDVAGGARSIVESIRYRSAAVSDPKLPRRVAVQKKLLHEARDSLNAYVVFLEQDPWVQRAVDELNGAELEFEGKVWHLRVDRASAGAKDAEGAAARNPHTIFCGNLPFSVNENDLYEHFGNCGPIDSVRVVRDRDSGMGKGIAFLAFKDAQSMRNALAFNATKFAERELRVTRAVENKQLHHKDVSAGKKGGKEAAGAKPQKGAAAAPGAAKGKDKGSAGGPARKEGYGGAGKLKVLNNAGVWKKPRHVPRNHAADPTQSRAASAGAATSSSTKGKARGQKRAFEGEHADPKSEVKKQKMIDAKSREKKEKRKIGRAHV